MSGGGNNGTAKKMNINPDNMVVLLVGSTLVLGSVYIPILDRVRVTLISKGSVESLEVLLDPWLLLDAQVVAMARGLYYQLKLVR